MDCIRSRFRPCDPITVIRHNRFIGFRHCLGLRLNPVALQPIAYNSSSIESLQEYSYRRTSFWNLWCMRFFYANRHCKAHRRPSYAHISGTDSNDPNVGAASLQFTVANSPLSLPTREYIRLDDRIIAIIGQSATLLCHLPQCR